MNWIKGISAKYYLSIVDADTWEDIERIEITDASVSASDSNLMESADIDVVAYDKGEQWVRLWLDARQDGSDAEHVAMFTGIATSPASRYNGKLQTNKLECYSVLKPVDEIPLMRGWYAPKGGKGTSIVKKLLETTPAPVVIDDGTEYPLSQNIIAENNESHLSMATKVLNAINWRFRIEGNGTIHLCPKADSIIASFDPIENDAVETTITVDYDLFKCPNVFMAIVGDTYAVARDESDSPISISVRGREVWQVEDNCNLNNGETLYQYAVRRLREEQAVALVASYNRRYNPSIKVGDYIRLHYPEQKVDGMFMVQSQSFELNYGATVSETSKKISDEVKYLRNYDNANYAEPIEYAVLIDELGNKLTDEFGSLLVE